MASVNPANVISIVSDHFSNYNVTAEFLNDERILASSIIDLILKKSVDFRVKKEYTDAAESYKQLLEREPNGKPDLGRHGLLTFADLKMRLDSRENGEIIGQFIERFDMLESIEFRGNTMGVEASKPIGEALSSQPYLKRAIWCDMFTGRLKEEIPKTLRNLCDGIFSSQARLVELDLSDNAIGPMAIPGISGFLASENASSLQVLKLNNCGLGVAGKIVAECLIECLRKTKDTAYPLQLRVFIAGRNRFELISTEALALAFTKIGTLEHIEMPQNGITAQGIKALSNAVSQSQSLRILNLNDNIFGKKGAMAMARALSEVSNLESIDFGDCLCRNSGSIEIARCLTEKHLNLKFFNMAGNEINLEAAKTISNLVRGISSLEKLKFDTNCFGSQFDDLTEYVRPFGFVDLGAESDDQGSISEEENDDESVEENNH